MTDPSVIEASNAWYAANVSNTPAQQASTAEQAAAINAAYRNNTLPVLPQYGDPVGTYGYNQRADFSGMSQEQRAVAYGQEGSPLILTYVGGDANTRGSPVYLTPQEYQTKFGISEVQAEQNKHIAAFSQPRNDLALSPAAQAIVNQYNATRYNTVTGGGRVQGSNPGSVYQENPYNPDSALGIAWDVARTGGGTDLRLNQIATGEAISMGVDPGFIRYATDLYYNRPALAQQNFTSPITGQQFQNNYWAGGPIRANLTISEIAAGGGVTPDNYLNASIYNASTRTMNPLASLATPVIGFESGIHVAPGDWGAPGSGNLIGGKTVAGTFGGDQTITLFVPISSYAQEGLPNSKILLDKQTGEIAIYRQNERFGTWDLISGGGRNALQSGMFTFDRASTPYVTDQAGVGTFKLPSGEGLSRLGAEAYGGLVQPMNGSLLAPNEAMSRYYGEGRYNLANLADVAAGGKNEAPGADIPWHITPGSPSVQYMNEKGVIPGSAIILDTGNLTGRTKVAGALSQSDYSTQLVLPTPFLSTSIPSQATLNARNEYQPSGFLGLGGLLPPMPRNEQVETYGAIWRNKYEANPVGALVEYAKSAFAAPASTVGGVANRLTFGLSDVLYTPTPITVNQGSTHSVNSEIFDLPTTRNTTISNLPTSTSISGGNQTITNLGNWLIGTRGSIDRTNLAAVNEYNAKADLFSQMQKQNPILVTTTGGTKSVTTESGGTRTVTTATDINNTKIYASEWDRFVEGSGRVGRWLTGETLAKQAAYYETIKNAPGVGGEAQRAVFDIGTTIINKPVELAPAAILGVSLAGAGEVIPGALAEIGASGGITGTTANFLTTPGGISLAKAGLVAVFESIYAYDVTNKFTATPEETKHNIYSSLPTLAAMYGGAGGFNWIGETSLVRGGSAPGGASFTGARIYDTYFGGGTTPTGRGYVGAFSPTESYVFTGNNPTPVGRSISAGALPETVLSPESVARASALTEPAENYQHIDLSGGARPFSVRTEAELQAEQFAIHRDLSGRAPQFSIGTEGEINSGTRATPVVSQVWEGDTSGRAPQFSMKTAEEIKSGVWDQAARLGGDTSGRPFGTHTLSVDTEQEFLTRMGLHADISGRAQPFSMQTQGEIMSGWEQEHALTMQNWDNLQYANEVARNRVRLGFMDTIIDTQSALAPELPSTQGTRWKTWEPQSELSHQSEYNPLNPNRGYAPAEQRGLGLPPSFERMVANGASRSALTAELARLHPALQRELGVPHQSEYNPLNPNRGYAPAEDERRSLPAPYRERTTPVTPYREQRNLTTGSFWLSRQPSIEQTTDISVTETTNPRSKTTVFVIPYEITTPKEFTNTNITPQEKTVPWEKTIPAEQPTKTVTPRPPLNITPLPPISSPSLPGGGGGGGGGPTRPHRRFHESFSLELGTNDDTFISGFTTPRGRAAKVVPAKEKAKGGKNTIWKDLLQ